MQKDNIRINAGNTGKFIFCAVLSAFFALLSACSDKGADKDISDIIVAWKTVDQTQTTVCRAQIDDLIDKKQADTSADFQESYMDFLGTLNAIRDYAKKNPSTRVEIRNTMYEVYGKMMYDSDKKEYLEAEGIGALRKAVHLNDKTLMAELYKMMADLTADEPLRSAIYDTKAIDILQDRGRTGNFYKEDKFAELAEIFFKAEDFNDAIKYGNLYLENSTEDSSSFIKRLSVMTLLGTAYLETNRLDSSSAMFENLLQAVPDSLDQTSEYGKELKRFREKASGRIGVIQAKWQQLALARESLEEYLKTSQQAKDTSDIIYAHLGLGQVHTSAHDDKKALAELRQARKYAVTKRFPYLQTKVYQELTRVFDIAGAEDSSSVCKRKLQMLEEKIQASRQDIELLKTRTEHELLQIQSDIETAYHEKVSKRSWTWLIILIAILLCIIALMVHGRRRFRTRIHKRIARQHEARQKEIAEGELKSITSKLIESSTPYSEQEALDKEKLTDLSTEDAWFVFRQKFCNAHPQFFSNLDKALGKKATPTYEKVAALLYMGLDNSQIGNLLGINKDSVARTRRRIRTDMSCEDLQKAISEM